MVSRKNSRVSYDIFFYVSVLGKYSYDGYQTVTHFTVINHWR